VLRGNPGRRPLNPHEAHPAVRIPSAPSELDDAAKKEWRRMSKILLRLGLLTEVDRAAFTGYCVAWSQWMGAMAQVQKLGPIIKSPTGFPIQNPYLAVANRAWKTVQGLLVEFGMTPASRSRVSAATSSDSDDETHFFGVG
jgi:P27 family predicted phage terminase small subunit